MIAPAAAMSSREIARDRDRHQSRGECIGMTFNMDTIWSTLVAGAHRPPARLLVRRALTKNTEDHVPTKLQLIWEAVVGEVNKQVEDNLGRVHPYVAPLAISLFFFILSQLARAGAQRAQPRDRHLLPAPTADTNLTYALARYDRQRLGLRHPAEGREGLLQALPRAVPRAAPAQHPRGARQADHAGAATLRQHLRRWHHARADRPDRSARLGAQRGLEAFDMFIGASRPSSSPC